MEHVKVRCSRIKWDTSDEDVGYIPPAQLGLPAKVILTVPPNEVNDENIADLLSDQYGYLVKSFTSQVLV